MPSGVYGPCSTFQGCARIPSITSGRVDEVDLLPLPREVQRLEDFEDPDALIRVAPFALDKLAEGLLARVAKWRVPDVMSQTHSLGERDIE